MFCRFWLHFIKTWVIHKPTKLPKINWHYLLLIQIWLKTDENCKSYSGSKWVCLKFRDGTWSIFGGASLRKVYPTWSLSDPSPFRNFIKVPQSILIALESISVWCEMDENWTSYSTLNLLGGSAMLQLSHHIFVDQLDQNPNSFSQRW